MENENPVVVIDQENDRKKRSGLAIVLAVAFVAMLGIGTTFAYLTWTTNQTPNRMTTDPKITADLLEPTWTEAAKASDKGTASDGKDIPKNADNMLPGTEVNKNPFIVNTSTNGSDEYCGIKIQFQKWTVTSDGADKTDKTAGSWANMNADEVAKVLKCYGFLQAAGSKASVAGFNDGTNNNVDDTWVQITGSDYGVTTRGTANSNGAMYFYNTTKITALASSWVAASESASDGHYSIPEANRTKDLFTQIRFIDTATQTDINNLNAILSPTGKTPADPGWRIVVSGAAVQATSDSSVTAATFATDSTANWKTLLDTNQTTTDVTATNLRPGAATGVRAGFTNGIPEVSDIAADGTDTTPTS